MVVLNFGVEGERFSGIQTEILETVIADQAPNSPKDILLVNISVADAEDNPLYASAYRTYYEQNTLVNGTEAYPDSLTPYGAIYGASQDKIDGNFEQLSDFSLLYGVNNEESFQESIKTVYGLVIIAVSRYNELLNENPDVIASAGRSMELN